MNGHYDGADVLPQHDSDGTEVVNIVLSHTADETKVEPSDGHHQHYAMPSHQQQQQQQDHFVGASSSDGELRSHATSTPPVAPYPNDIGIMARRDDRRTKSFSRSLFSSSSAAVNPHLRSSRDGGDEDDLHPANKRLYGNYPSSNGGGGVRSVVGVSGSSSPYMTPRDIASVPRRRPIHGPRYGPNDSHGRAGGNGGGDEFSRAGNTHLDPSAQQLPTPGRSSSYGYSSTGSGQTPPLMAALDCEPTSLVIPGDVGDNGDARCVFCNKSQASVVCLGAACCTFLNGKLPVLCTDCSNMLHTHHPHHRLFYCQHGGSGGRYNDDCMDNTLSDVSCRDDMTLSPASPQVHKVAKASNPNNSKSKNTKLELLENVHQRYMTMLLYFVENPTTSMIDAYKATGLSRTTLQDNRWITELKIVDENRYDELMSAMLNEDHLPRLSIMSMACQEVLTEEPYASQVAQMRANRRLLPFTPVQTGTSKPAPTHEITKRI